MKKRADILLVEKGLCGSREEASRLILAGKARAGSDRLVKKPSELFDEATALSLDGKSPYVSRGAYKLLPGLNAYLPSLEGLVALDIGASTGGFSDLMLQRGAKKVYAVDVGRGQLHSKLRGDPRVVSIEKVNARRLGRDMIPEDVDVLAVDVSFISVLLVLPPASALMKEGAWAFVLVKPQFEAGRKDVGKNGVVRDESVRLACVSKVADYAAAELRWSHLATIPSPIKGPSGNQEYMLVFRKADAPS